MHLDVLGLDGDGWNDVALLQLLEMGMLSLSSSELVMTSFKIAERDNHFGTRMMMMVVNNP